MSLLPRPASLGGLSARSPDIAAHLAPVDVFSTQKRSEVMRAIRGSGTKPELALRSLLHRAGDRFTVNGPRNRSLPGRPDVVLPKWSTVIPVHGWF